MRTQVSEDSQSTNEWSTGKKYGYGTAAEEFGMRIRKSFVAALGNLRGLTLVVNGRSSLKFWIGETGRSLRSVMLE
jgi:hypothetical protein